MANTSLAGSPQQTHAASRIERGLRLFEQRGIEFRHELRRLVGS